MFIVVYTTKIKKTINFKCLMKIRLNKYILER